MNYADIKSTIFFKIYIIAVLIKDFINKIKILKDFSSFLHSSF